MEHSGNKTGHECHKRTRIDIRTSDGRAYFVDSPEYFGRSREGNVVTYFTPEHDRAPTIRVSQIVSLEVANHPAG